ncbi:transcriptional regulator [Staphylococcus nepalensis]|uniref:LacI family DNA-binding transcriptional regulator n=1 Tax=Staphylococcus nepalensis TaxID=214473 RepID=UPI000D58A1EF|nr:LacI family DNA-binding transcriptional regulator [Staphylococcus nepalensis]AWI43683.1 transcriptional regulator [Staphylococcus nepalensis]
MANNKPTLHDVAKVADVSIATVSNVLNNKSTELGIKTKQKVLDAIEKLNYEPNHFARSLKTGQSNLIVFIVPDQNPFFTEILTELNNECQKHHLHVAVVSSEENELKQQVLIETFIGQNVSAIILVPVKSRLNLKKEWHQTPILTIDRKIYGEALPSISVDNEKAAFNATQRIVDSTSENIGLLLANPDISTTSERKRGYELALAKNNITIDQQLIYYSNQQLGTDAQIDSGYHATRALIYQGVRAIVATNHLLLLGALQAIKESGKKITEDIIIVGFDDSYWNEIYTPKLSVISQPTKEIGRVAGEMIHNLIQGKAVASVELSTKLLIRESCSFVSDKSF